MVSSYEEQIAELLPKKKEKQERKSRKAKIPFLLSMSNSESFSPVRPGNEGEKQVLHLEVHVY